ncbi:hypothetical protein SLEP1_g54012 [Rubroshorea leprosula]|uniref:Uncharacterized protein n=1 Tax=Rubroshorea leprosula TaxID=152421 RepID=A0AAV5MB26_9ROSI|nr:hypothetical protein SLEP1_g54012 [Rubroshorea leprosula]
MLEPTCAPSSDDPLGSVDPAAFFLLRGSEAARARASRSDAQRSSLLVPRVFRRQIG